MPQTRALIIGIDQHDDPRIPSLRGCRADVGAWLGTLFPLMGLPAEQYRVLLSGPTPLATELSQGRALRAHNAQALLDAGCFGAADTKSILAGFEWLVQGAEKGERAVLIYAGFGTVISVGKRRRVRAIVPQDALLETTEEVVPAISGAATLGRAADSTEDGPVPLEPAAAPARGARPRTRTLPQKGTRPLRPQTADDRPPKHLRYPTRVRGAIPLPELATDGTIVPAGHALDRAANTSSAAWANLTVVLDTSFEPVQSDVHLGVRSLPAEAPRGPCLPVYVLSSRTLCAARPGHHAHETGSGGAFTQATAPWIRGWATGLAADGETLYWRTAHQTVVSRAAETLRSQSLVQQPTVSGHRGVGLASLFCPGLDCSCVDELLAYTPPPESQVHAGNNGVRVYELRFQATGPAGLPLWQSMGWVASVGESVSAAFQIGLAGATQQHAGGLSASARSAAPGSSGPAGSGAAAYPREYRANREYWRLHDAAVVAFFDAHAQGRLLSLEVRAVRDHAWNTTANANAANAAWYTNTFEAGTRKRHCATFPDWPSRVLTAPSGTHSVHVQAPLGGGQMVVQFERSPLQPGVVSRIRWHHARFIGGNHPTFFGGLQVGGTGVVFGVTGGLQPPPTGRSCWYTAESTMQKLPSDP